MDPNKQAGSIGKKIWGKAINTGTIKKKKSLKTCKKCRVLTFYNTAPLPFETESGLWISSEEREHKNKAKREISESGTVTVTFYT